MASNNTFKNKELELRNNMLIAVIIRKNEKKHKLENVICPRFRLHLRLALTISSRGLSRRASDGWYWPWDPIWQKKCRWKKKPSGRVEGTIALQAHPNSTDASRFNWTDRKKTMGWLSSLHINHLSWNFNKCFMLSDQKHYQLYRQNHYIYTTRPTNYQLEYLLSGHLPRLHQSTYPWSWRPSAVGDDPTSDSPSDPPIWPQRKTFKTQQFNCLGDSQTKWTINQNRMHSTKKTLCTYPLLFWGGLACHFIDIIWEARP